MSTQNNLVVGLDADDVIFDTSKYLVEHLNEIKDLGGVMDSATISDFKVDLMRGDMSVPGVKEFLGKYFTPAISEIPAKSGAKETIDWLRDSGAKVLIITARGEKAFPGSVEATNLALNKAGINVDGIVYDSVDKALDCDENKVNVFVDDSFRHCSEVRSRLGILVIGFLSDVNRGEFEKSDLVSVNDWRELRGELEKDLK